MRRTPPSQRRREAIEAERRLREAKAKCEAGYVLLPEGWMLAEDVSRRFRSAYEGFDECPDPRKKRAFVEAYDLASTYNAAVRDKDLVKALVLRRRIDQLNAEEGFGTARSIPGIN